MEGNSAKTFPEEKITETLFLFFTNKSFKVLPHGETLSQPISPVGQMLGLDEPPKGQTLIAKRSLQTKK